MSYIDELEEVEVVVSDWAVNIVNLAITALSPNGRPYGHVEQSDQEMLNEYFGLRGDPEAWAKYLGDLILQSNQRLQDAGLNPEQIKACHVEDTVQKFALQYSYDMEQLLEKENGEVSGTGRKVEASSSEVLPAGAGGQSSPRY